MSNPTRLKRIPFCPMPVERALRIARRFNFMAERLSKMSPGLGLTLEQANMKIEKIEYLSLALFSAAFMSIMVFGCMLVVSLYMPNAVMGLMISVGVGFLMFFVVIVYLLAYPRMHVRRRVNEMERNLLYGLKHILIQIKSGVPLFDSFISLSKCGYGGLSDEFVELVKEVEMGSSMEVEIEKLAIRNPSSYLRRALWQLSNGMKAGSDISTVLQSIIENITKEQGLALRRYGSQLNPLTLVYMMVAVIIPALGITMLIVLSSFSGMEISETLLLGIFFALSFLQFMYMGLIKSKRPNI